MSRATGVTFHRVARREMGRRRAAERVRKAGAFSRNAPARRYEIFEGFRILSGPILAGESAHERGEWVADEREERQMQFLMLCGNCVTAKSKCTTTGTTASSAMKLSGRRIEAASGKIFLISGARFFPARFLSARVSTFLSLGFD